MKAYNSFGLSNELTKKTTNDVKTRGSFDANMNTRKDQKVKNNLGTQKTQNIDLENLNISKEVLEKNKKKTDHVYLKVKLKSFFFLLKSYANLDSP